MSPFLPVFAGELALDPLPEDFATRIQRRVESGLFVPGRRARADYLVTSRDRSGITFEAQGFLTVYNVGLNHVSVSRSGGNRIRYQVSYWGWTRAAVIHGLLLGGAFAAAATLHPPLQRDIAAHPQGPAIFWGMVVFWGLFWPWLLTAFHRPHAERALQRILRDTLGEHPAPGTGATMDTAGATRVAS